MSKTNGEDIADAVDRIAVWRARGLMPPPDDQWKAHCRREAEAAKRELAQRLERT